MHRTLLSLIFLNISLSLFNQEHPDLGLNGVVTWLDDTHIRVEYDWSSDAQLLDWEPTVGSTLVRENSFITVTGGYSDYVRSMIWKQNINCSRILAGDASPLASAGHLNFYSNLISFSGSTWLPDPGLGAVLATTKNFWVHDGEDVGTIGTSYITVGVARDYEYTVSTDGMTIKSSADNIVYSYINLCVLDADRMIALGGWGGNTKWGKITVEGEIILPEPEDPVPSDVINIQSDGAVFAPVIEVTGTPVIEWIFDDATTSTSATPVKNYGSSGSRRNYLKVTPWSALIGINVGYDAADGGYGNFAMVGNQYVLKFENLSLAKSTLQYLCANYSLITELDLKGFNSLEFLEFFRCKNLSKLSLDSHPVLERLCVEDCDLDYLDLSGCTGLGDLRGALNAYSSINWGSAGQSLWHICIRDNPQMTENIPSLIQFPALTELLNWNSNQTGPLICNSPLVTEISSYSNNYTSADLAGCSGLRILSLSGSQLASLNIGTAAGLTNIKLDDCALTQSQVDYVMQTLDVAGRSNGTLDLTANEAPSVVGMTYLSNLIKKGWTVEIMTGTEDPEDDTESMSIILNGDEMRIQLNENFISWQASLYNLNGERILSKLLDSDELIFNISPLASGMYIVELFNGSQRKVKKVIKP